ncbi:hypothetical protein E4198_11390 [Streptomyces sp. RKND-216]|nr:hypothetical protein [Streptomyces sp. RKND-216]THA25250.1 hypothetical protein E4198_11390 [Streptomyces sp. RKND-216]
MGLTHDHRDVAREHKGPRRGRPVRGGDRLALRHPREPALGIPRILGRRARWFGARLRHPRA